MRLLRFFGLWNRSSTVRWLLRLFRQGRHRKRLDAELRFHLEQQIADDIAGGTAPEEARRRARLEFGGLEQTKEDCRNVHWEIHLENLFRDFRYALRASQGSPLLVRKPSWPWRSALVPPP